MRDAQTYLVDQIKVATGLLAQDVEPIRASRQSTDVGGVRLPSVIWRLDGDQRVDSSDGPSYPHIKFFEVECRSKTCDGAQAMAQDILDAIFPRLSHVLADYDEPDDPSQKRGEYYSHILEVGLTHA